MALLQRSLDEVRELMLILARIGLEHRVRPIRDNHSTITSQLFELDSEVSSRELALSRFADAYKATPPIELGPGDARIYRREHERRQRHLLQLTKERDELLETYATELLASPRQHEALQAIYAELGVTF